MSRDRKVPAPCSFGPMHSQRDKYGLPPRLFLYTLDQLADMLQLWPIDPVIYFDGRSVGAHPLSKMIARNIMPPGEKPEWRVEESEFIRWMRHQGVLPMTRVNRRMGR